MTLVYLLTGCAAGGSVRAGDVSPAIDDQDRYQGGVPDTRTRNSGAVALEAQALEQQSAGDHERAAATLERALRLDPDDPALWISLGEIRLSQGRAGMAESLGLRAEALAGSDRAQGDAARALITRARRER